MEKTTKIYFCGSIRGGRELASSYQEIIGIIRRSGEVLTEHVGDKEEISSKDRDLTDKQIHNRDLLWIRESEVVIAEVTVPSLGVGYEIGRAIELGKPILCLFNSNYNNKLSAMIAGSEGLNMHYYTETASLSGPLTEFIQKYASRRTS